MQRMVRTSSNGFWSPIALIALLILGTSCGSAGEDNVDHTAQVEEWRSMRDSSLRAEDSWLTLVGLFPVEEGKNDIGSDPEKQIRLPEGKAPAHVGYLNKTGGDVTMIVADGVEVTHNGEPIKTIEMRSDSSGDPTVLEIGTVSFYVIDRDGELSLRVKDSESQVRLGFTGIDNYPIAGEWQVRARFEPYTPAKEIDIPVITGGTRTSSSPGALVFEKGGKSHRLDALEAASELWLIFGDETNGTDTYGGGRFLYTPKPDKDGFVLVDFNKAYNPPCMFTPYATCPLPPEQNRLELAVLSGEKIYRGPVVK